MKNTNITPRGIVIRSIAIISAALNAQALLAQEQCTPYTNVNQRITAPGNYCLTGNLVATSNTGVQIEADNVTLDLKGFTLSSTYVDEQSVITGIYSSRSNIKIKNGVITGFGRGVNLNALSPSTGRYLVQDVTVISPNKGNGITLSGPNSTARNNTVIGTTGCYPRAIEVWGGATYNTSGPITIVGNVIRDTRSTDPRSYSNCYNATGIFVRRSNNASIHSNTIENTVAEVGGTATGIDILIETSTPLGALDVWKNKIINAAAASRTIGISLTYPPTHAVVNNSAIEGFETGIFFYSFDEVLPLYLYNRIVGATTAFDGKALLGPGNQVIP